jgi:hypothetical protein
MPEGLAGAEIPDSEPTCLLAGLKPGKRDSLGALVHEILFRGPEYAIYSSDRGVYVHFSDDKSIEKDQRQAYTTLSGQICELRYLTSQMHGSSWPTFGGSGLRTRTMRQREPTIYDHNMAQALMLVMESQAERACGNADDAKNTENRAKEIADRALDMAVRRVTADNTIRYVSTAITAGLVWLLFTLVLLFFIHDRNWGLILISSLTGVLGAIFSVTFRAQAFELKPCDDSQLNKLMAMIRVGMGGIAGPSLLLLVLSAFAKSEITLTGDDHHIAIMVAALGLISGFAERLVPNVVQSAAAKIESQAGTPVQAAAANREHP